MRTYVFAVAAFFAAAGCNSNSTGSAAPQPQPPNISGDYAGSLTDSQFGNSTATATLAQHGSTAGGSLATVQGSSPVNAALSFAIAAPSNVSGSMVINYANGTTCSFSTAGTYNPTTNVLSGSYSAVTNCGGQSGTFTLTQQCLDTPTAAKRKTTSGPAHC